MPIQFNLGMVFILLTQLCTLSFAESPYDGMIIGSDQQNDRIYIMDPDKKNLNNGVEWSLSLDELSGVEPGELAQISGLEIKRVMGGSHILVLAKKVILIDVEKKEVVWYGRSGGGNPHSAELLPDGNVVVAASEGAALKFFDTSMPNNSLPVNEYKFKNAHGVVWDAKREVLWATGSDQLHALAYNFKQNNPNIDSVVQENFIEKNGHDLSPVPGEDKLLFTSKSMWVFDIESRTTTKIGTKGAKSMTQNESGEIIYTTGVGSNNPYGIGKYQTPHISSIDGQTRTFTGAGFYKVRWFIPSPFSYPEYDGDNDDQTTGIGEVKSEGVIQYIDQQILVEYEGSYRLRVKSLDGSSAQRWNAQGAQFFDMSSLQAGRYVAVIKKENSEIVKHVFTVK